MPTYFDTETCGLHGPIVLLQKAVDDGPVEFHHVWLTPIKETMRLLEELVDSYVVAYNLAFDWFHVCQMYTTLTLMEDKDKKLVDCIEEYAINEEQGRYVDLCLKPRSCFDVFLHARKTKYQSTMDRKPIKIRKVPVQLAAPLAAELTKRIPLSDVYFARKSNQSERWVVRERPLDPDFRDVVLDFAPSSGLKALAFDALGVERVLKFDDVGVPKSLYPKEIGYAPFALANGLPGFWNGAWPDKIHGHIAHWATNKRAAQYATDDVIYTRDLYKHFPDCEADDVDSVLAALVGAVRWRGFDVDIPALKDLRDRASDKLKETVTHDFNRPIVCKRYINEVLSDMEVKTLHGSTKKQVLEQLTRWTLDDICPTCEGMGCDKCNTTGLAKGTTPHPVAERAKAILTYREQVKEVELYDKLISAGRFHASFKVIGALSGRMSGADGLNPQGIKKAKYVRKCFPLAPPGFSLCGGDFDSFEVNILDAVFGDPLLHDELMTGKKIHGLWGASFFGKTYDEILATDGLPGMANLYTRSKSGVFALIYGGVWFTLVDRLAIDESSAKIAYERMLARYKVWAKKREEIERRFVTLRQVGGIGSKVIWTEPAEYIESMFGFRRYFTLENQIVKTLYDISNNPPKEWKDIKIKVMRRDREQLAANAVRSALLGAAFAVQGSNMRAAANHIIQSAGATLTKRLECKLWEMQPHGIAPWQIIPMNIHDEVMAPTRENRKHEVIPLVNEFIVANREHVPLLAMSCHIDMKTWAEK